MPALDSRMNATVTPLHKTASSVEAPPVVKRRILTDHPIPQIAWWSTTVTLLPPPRGGILEGAAAVSRMLRHACAFEVFVSASVRNALAIGLFKRLTGRACPRLVITEMRLDDPRADVRWRAKVAVQRFAFAAADVICVSARREAEIYSARLGVPIDRFTFVPWHTNVLDPGPRGSTGDYLFAAGRTGRDWDTLAAAVRGLAVRVTVVCSEQDARRVSFPDNVEVLTDVPYDKYRALLEHAMAVLVPLTPHAYSSGQVVILEAMALGKAVIATRVLGSEDYIVNDKDGLLVSPGDASELREAIQQILAAPGLAERLGRAAVEKVVRTHTLEHYVRTIINIAEDQPPC